MILYPPTKPIKQITWAKISWAAGFFEGDGTLNQKTHTISVAQAHIEPLLRLRNIFGGSIRKRPLDPRNPNGFMYDWYINNEQAKTFIHCIFSLLSPQRQKQVQKVIQ